MWDRQNRAVAESVIMHEKLFYISTSNICAFKPRWICCQHEEFIFFSLLFSFPLQRNTFRYRGDCREHLPLWQYGSIVQSFNFFTAWKIFITKCQRGMLFSKLWSHCLHSAHNQFSLLSPESHNVAFSTYWIVDVSLSCVKGAYCNSSAAHSSFRLFIIVMVRESW